MIYVGTCVECKTGTFESNAPNRKYCDTCQPIAKARSNREAWQREKQDYQSRRVCVGCKTKLVEGRAWYCVECKERVRSETHKKSKARCQEATDAPLIRPEAWQRLLIEMVQRCPRNEGCYDCIVWGWCKNRLS